MVRQNILLSPMFSFAVVVYLRCARNQLIRVCARYIEYNIIIYDLLWLDHSKNEQKATVHTLNINKCSREVKNTYIGDYG